MLCQHATTTPTTTTTTTTTSTTSTTTTTTTNTAATTSTTTSTNTASTTRHHFDSRPALIVMCIFMFDCDQAITLVLVVAGFIIIMTDGHTPTNIGSHQHLGFCIFAFTCFQVVLGGLRNIISGHDAKSARDKDDHGPRCVQYIQSLLSARIDVCMLIDVLIMLSCCCLLWMHAFSRWMFNWLHWAFGRSLLPITCTWCISYDDTC